MFDKFLPYLPQIAAILMAASRLLPKSEVLWQYVPAKARWVLPVLVVALPQIADAIGMVKSPIDFVEAFTLALALLVPGARSATHAQLAKDLEPPPTPKDPSENPGVGLLPIFLVVVASSYQTACYGPAVEKPPCDEATLAKIVATCESESDCNNKLDERQAFCAKRIKED